MEATIRLFKALPVKTKEQRENKELFEKTIILGFAFSPEVIANYSNYDDLIDLVRKTIGLTAEEINSSFHKSWIKVRDADIIQLFIEQIYHYFTTYGKEALGIKDDYVYIPKEELNIPEIDIDEIKIVIIKGYTKEELKEKLVKFLNSGIALNDKTKKDVIDISLFVGLADDEIVQIKNKEVRVVLYDYLNLIPSNPVEFLRFIIYKVTEKTLIIKNPDLIAEIKSKQNINIIKLFNDYEMQYGLNRLAEIFYRFKPLFLAFRTNIQLKKIINSIRRLAIKFHKPMAEDYLNTITSKIKNGIEIDKNLLQEELEKVNIFRKIKLAYALKFRTKNISSILYKIRNGKGYATEFSFNSNTESILELVLDSITKDVSNNLKDKKIYIPDYIEYSLPATEKQFTGYFPSGTCVKMQNDMIFGINWYNNKGNRIDLDLSVISADSKIGWDSQYRNDERTILFSGDMTGASGKNGATELFYIARQVKTALILLVNYYNFNPLIEVPFKILIAKEKPTDFEKNYMVNPNNILALSNSTINLKQKILGLIITNSEEQRFYFAETYIGRSITSSNNKFTEHSRNYLFGFYENTISLNEILEKSGAILTDKKDCEIDLSPENLEKDTIINLLIK